MDAVLSRPRVWNLGGSRDSSTVLARPSDGLVTFSVLWALALIFSVANHLENLTFRHGLTIALIEWVILGAAVAVILRPRQTLLLWLLAGAMALQYVHRLPVASNNQTIAFFMNAAILTVVGIELARWHGGAETRERAYERLRIVARSLLATMYFFGIFHKINVDFLDPEVSCAVALYKPIVAHLGLGDNLIGHYGAIATTFVLESVTLVCLYWRRYFAVGLILGLVFHYIIPISAYAWYMDFSSLVLALYVLSVPREVSVAFAARCSVLLARARAPTAGLSALLLFALVLAAGTVLVLGVAQLVPARTPKMMWHSVWLLCWAVVGGSGMVVLTGAALAALPYRPAAMPRQPLWLHAFGGVLFVSCLSPYVGLKTDSSITMFSNLHTEGGETNHLLLDRPIYLFGYQRSVARIEGSSHSAMRKIADRRLSLVRFSLEEWMRVHPNEWVTFTMDGVRHRQVVAADLAIKPRNWLERRLLVFKPVDHARPKVCSH